MNNLFEQWNQGIKLLQQMPPLNSKILENFTFARPGFRLNLANLDEQEQFFRMITGLDTKHLEGFSYLQPYLANFKNSEGIVQRQMNIV